MTDSYARVDIAQPALKELADAVADENADRYAREKVKRDPEGQRRYMEAYRKVAAEDAVQQSWDANDAEYRAKTHIYSILAEGYEDELGPERGREAVRRVRQRQGEKMGTMMAERVRAKGKRLSLGNFFEEFWSYFSWSPHVDAERYYDESGELVKYVLRLNCPIGDYLKENAPDVEFASNYCDLDEFIIKAYNPNTRYSRRHWVPGGDEYSELIWELDSADIID